MDIQAIRRYYETPVIDACTAAGAEYRAENTLEPNGDAVSSFATGRLQFGEMFEDTVGCAPRENIRAVFVVEFYCEKGKGPKEAQDFMQGLLCEMRKLKGINSLVGPSFTALGNTPYFFASMSFGLVVPAELD